MPTGRDRAPELANQRSCWYRQLVRVCTKRVCWLSLCAVLAACSRPHRRPSCGSLGTDKARQAEMVRVGLTRTGCAGAGAIAVLEHRAELKLQLSPPILAGHGEVHVRALVPTRVLELDTAGLRISSASTLGKSLKFKQEGDSTCLESPQPLAAGDELTLALGWAAQPPVTGATFSADQAWSGSRTPLWLPTKLGHGQRATLSLILTTPDDLKLFGSHSQALLSTRLGDGLRHVHYQARNVIRWAFSLVSCMARLLGLHDGSEGAVPLGFAQATGRQGPVDNPRSSNSPGSYVLEQIARILGIPRVAGGSRKSACGAAVR